MKIDLADVRITAYKVCDIRRFILETLLYLASGQVEEAVLFLESAIKYTYEVEDFFKKLEEALAKEEKREKEDKKKDNELVAASEVKGWEPADYGSGIRKLIS